MEPLYEALRLIKRQTELENAMRRPGGIRVTEERELFQLWHALTQYPAAVTAIIEAAARMRRPIDSISLDDIEGSMSAASHWHQGSGRSLNPTSHKDPTNKPTSFSHSRHFSTGFYTDSQSYGIDHITRQHMHSVTVTDNFREARFQILSWPRGSTLHSIFLTEDDSSTVMRFEK
jgi:hypothetical protein